MKKIVRISALLLMLSMLLAICTGCFRSLLQSEFEYFLDETLVGMAAGSEFSYKNIFLNPQKYGLSYRTHQLIDPSVVDFVGESTNNKEELNAALAQITAISPVSLSKPQRVSYYALRDYLETQIRYADVPDYSSLISPGGGFIANMGISFYEYPFDTVKDIEHYLAFLENIPDALDTVVAYTEKQMNVCGYVVTEYVVEKNCDYLSDYASFYSSSFVLGFKDKIRALDFLSDSKKDALIDENERIMKEIVIPAFKECSKTIKNWETGEARPLAEYVGGKEYYCYLLEMNSGTQMTPNEMIEYLEDAYMHYVGVIGASTQSSIQNYLDGQYGTTVRSPENAIELLRDATERNLPAFEDPGCTLSDLPASLSVSGMLAYYLIPQADSSDKNIVRLNREELGNSSNLVAYMDTIAHESYPGHLYQINYWRQNGIHPMINWMNFTAVTEGWADFISQRSLKWIGFSNGVADIITAEYITSQILSALADIQVNYKGMNSEELNEYLCKLVGTDLQKNMFDAVYDYVVADPGVLIPYAMGFLQVTELENEVKNALKEKYDEKDFYKAYLDAGVGSFGTMRKLIFDQLGIKE